MTALAVHNGRLIAGGQFSTAGSQPTTTIAAWDGISWQPLGSGLSGNYDDVSALTVYNGDLIAGGHFTMAGGLTANYVARWDGVSWYPLGSGTGDMVSALGVYRDRLVAAGYFHTAGGQPAEHVAQWDGVSWAPLGAGLAGYVSDVHALAVFDDDLVAAGRFTLTGGEVASRWARWHPADPTITLQPVDATVFAGLPVMLVVHATGTGSLSYRWLKDGVSLSDDGRVSGSATATLTIDPTTLPDSGSYQVVISDDCNSITSEVALLTVRQALGDFDLDGDVDQKDFGQLQGCFSGPGVAQAESVCADVLLDEDSDVDQGDFDLFLACMTGSGVAPAPSCVR
ncbi:MAG: immunoglobulin domain-containing protein [Planctomycetes bacterium]|nr:immunoglobulin domain-containing protein [Planctomycetota bacterium]